MREAEPAVLEQPPGRDDHGLVRSWRIVRFINIGIPVDTAIDLADSRLDAHDVENLLERGCPLPTALEILL